ncbi:MAG: DUF748 domain-containing protein, partial [Planctomycetes bacterium]|nr:DUF748 domain-containing protein [Planctomycetota bacterium]
VVREADGALAFAGLRTVAVAAADVPTEQPAAPADPAPPGPLPKLRLGSFVWSGARLSYTDRGRTPAATVALSDLQVRADALAFGEDAPPGRVQLSFALPDAARACRAEVALRSRADGLTTQLQWRTDGLTLNALRPWLEAAGLQPELQDGSVTVDVEADLQLRPTFAASAAVSNLRLTDGETRWLSLRALRGDGVAIGPDGLQLGSWTAQDPYLEVHRDKEQVLHACGMRLAGGGSGDGAVGTTPPGAERPAVAAAPMALQHGAITVDRATVRWTDEVAPETGRAIGLDLTIGPQPRRDAPVDITADLRLSEAAATARLQANLHRTADRIRASGELRADRLAASELQPLLPAGVRCTFDDGAVRATFEADLGI